MNSLLIFFAIPLAVIILSSILESFINCPVKVAGIFFSIFIVLAFAFGGTAELIVAAIIYTLISFITAIIIRYVINRRCNCTNSLNNSCNTCNFQANNTSNLDNEFSVNNFNYLNSLNRLGNAATNENMTNTLSNETTNFEIRNGGCNCRRYR